MKNEEKSMESLLQKLELLESGKEIQLTKEEAKLYRLEVLDELPEEDHVENLNRM